MAQRTGRKPLSTSHVNSLAGSQHAKDRLRVFLETLRGEMTIPQACQLLELSESHFHQARHQWLQEAVELLEPRPAGRPRKRMVPEDLAGELCRARAEIDTLREQLRGAQVREEVARILADPGGEPGKKTEDSPLPSLKPR